MATFLRATRLLRTQRLPSLAPVGARGFAFWKDVALGPKDPILGVSENFAADPHPEKINVGVGAYRDDNGKPFPLPSVQEAELQIATSLLPMEYSPISGLPQFVECAVELGYGTDPQVTERVAALQSLSGTGALRLMANFAAMQSNFKKVLLPNPTWGNHFPIFQHAGIDTETYRYWDPKTLGLNLEVMLKDLEKAEPSILLLHACAHNPTGVDPTLAQWQQISDVAKKAGHFVIFDNAYQGFASGDTDKDGAAIRLFLEEGHLFGMCQSFAKNFGLYGQRIGCASILCANKDEKARVESQLKIIARAIYSNPPLHGARIVASILSDPDKKAQWQAEIRLMSGRIIEMRQALKQALHKAGSKKNWDHITSQIGMFSYTGVTPEQCKFMTEKFNVYLTSNGRISMAGVTSGNVGRLAQALHEATKDDAQ